MIDLEPATTRLGEPAASLLGSPRDVFCRGCSDLPHAKQARLAQHIVKTVHRPLPME